MDGRRGLFPEDIDPGGGSSGRRDNGRIKVLVDYRRATCAKLEIIREGLRKRRGKEELTKCKRGGGLRRTCVKLSGISCCNADPNLQQRPRICC